MAKFIPVAALAGLMLTACANPPVVATANIWDDELTCRQLEDQIAVAEQYRRHAQGQKGATPTNVAGSVAFPAVMVGYGNIREATQAADTRKARLIDLYNAKYCE